MKKKFTLRTLKSLVLTVLVLTSVILSEVLWNANWINSGGIAYPAPVIVKADTPVADEVLRPYEITLSQWTRTPSKTQTAASLAIPGSPAYAQWITQLQNLRVTGLHPIASLPQAEMTEAVTFRFGTPLSYNELLKWIPGLQPSVLFQSGQTLWLYRQNGLAGVQLGIETQQGAYTALTDLSVPSFHGTLSQDIKTQPWTVWSARNHGYVPLHSLQVTQWVYHTQVQPVLPLAHSFFVNPQVLTSAQAGPHTVLWTDGSRVVWWDQVRNQLTFADPNAPHIANVASVSPSFVLAYVQDHGGAPSTLLFSNPGVAAGSDWFTLRTYVSGLPVFGGNGMVQLEVQGNQVLQYQCPLWQLTTPETRFTVHTLSAPQVAQVLAHALPNTPLTELTVQLGYAAFLQSPHTVELDPAFAVTVAGKWVLTLDAVTGQVMKGVTGE